MGILWTVSYGDTRSWWSPSFRSPERIGAIFWIARTGSPWRDLPEEFGKWSNIYRQSRRWTLSGLWELILDALNDSDTLPDKVQMIDSTIIRAHHLAAGAKGGLKDKVLAAQNLRAGKRLSIVFWSALTLRPRSTSSPMPMDCQSKQTLRGVK